MKIPLIFEKSRKGHRGYLLPAEDGGGPSIDEMLPESHIRKEPPRLPEVTEAEAVRHRLPMWVLRRYRRLHRQRDSEVDPDLEEGHPRGRARARRNRGSPDPTRADQRVP